MRFWHQYYFFAFLLIASCQQPTNNDNLPQDSLSFSDLHPFYLVKDGLISIDFKIDDSIQFEQALEDLPAVVAHYFIQFPDSDSLTFAPNHKIVNRYPYKVSIKDLKESLNVLSPQNLNNENMIAGLIMYNSNLKTRLNEIFKPYGFSLYKIMTEKSLFERKDLNDSLKLKKDSFEFNRKFIGMAIIRLVRDSKD